MLLQVGFLQELALMVCYMNFHIAGEFQYHSKILKFHTYMK